MRLSLALSLVAVLSCKSAVTTAPPEKNTALPVAIGKVGHTPPPSAARVPLAAAGPAGAWTTVNVSFTASTMLLLTDGRIMCQNENAADWWILTPDHTGSYVNGSWAQTASMSKGRMYYASAVLSDGRVAVFGGEYAGSSAAVEDDTGEIYNPQTNTWSPLGPPPGWANMGDAPNMLLPNGEMLLGSIMNTSTAIWNPATNAWSDGGTKLTTSAEESWVLLPNGNIVTVDCTRTQESELWVAGQGWIEGGKIPVDVVETSSEEIGPALLLADGRVIFFGATGHTVVYTPGAGNTGTWAAGPDIPADSTGAPAVSKDAPAVLLTNGHILLTASSPGSDGWGGPTSFFDVNPSTNPISIVLTTAPPNNAQSPYEGRLMLLPTGEVMYTQGSAQVSFLAAAATTLPAPVVTEAPVQADAGASFAISGTGFNGVSQTVAYGDDASSPTNYPIVRLTNAASGDVTYARTSSFSTMGVALGNATVTASVALPASLAAGTYNLQVVANGITSAAVSLQVSASTNPVCTTCTDVAGVCQPGTATSACGTGGGACAVCAANAVCTNGACVASTTTSCAHPLCTAGSALTAGCDPCATSVCAQDSYCCATAWDSQCTGEVTSICGQTCN